MANHIRTVMTYTLNGQVDFPITFEYLARKFVQITLIGKDRRVLTLNNDYRFSTKTQITTNRVWTSTDDYQYLEIRRITSATERLVDFADGSILRAYDLNIAQLQAIHIAEEARDLTADTIGVNEEGNLDARGRRIVNLADPINDYDAINLKIVKVWNESALNSANKAKEYAESAWKGADRAEEFTESAWIAEEEARFHMRRANEYADKSAASADWSDESAERSEEFANKSKEYSVLSEDAKRISTEQADRSWKGADRAEEFAESGWRAADKAWNEANKLGNWNQLAGSIQQVIPESGQQGGEVSWKYRLSSDFMNVNRKLSIGDRNVDSNTDPFISFNNSKDTWCGDLITSKDGNLNYRGNKMVFKCDVNVDKDLNSNYIYSSNGITSANSIKVTNGDIQLLSGAYYTSNRAVPLSGNIWHVPSTAMHRGVNDDSHSAYTYLETSSDSDVQVSYTMYVKDTTKNQEAHYRFTTNNFHSDKNIIVSWGGRTAVYQENGDITGTNNVWKGGSLLNHVNIINNSMLMDLRLGGKQTYQLNSSNRTLDLDNGHVITGMHTNSNYTVNQLYYRPLVALKGDGTWYVIVSE